MKPNFQQHCPHIETANYQGFRYVDHLDWHLGH